MKLNNIDISKELRKAEEVLQTDNTLSSVAKEIIASLLTITTLLLNQLNLNSSNSSKPPSTDQNLTKNSKGYKFLPMSNIDEETEIEPKQIYLAVNDGVIHYKCLNLNNEVVEGTITQSELPEGVKIPLTNKLIGFIEIKKFILDVTYKKGHTKKCRHPGGQKGHNGVTLEPVDNPDEIKPLSIDQNSLDPNLEYSEGGYLPRQVVEITINKKIIEYRAEILIDTLGNKYIAEFPDNVTRPIQYGSSVKTKAVCLSVYQLLPYARIQEHFGYEYNIPFSTGTIYNSIVDASTKLINLEFDSIVKQKLVQASIAYADETSLNLNGIKIWLHGFCNKEWTWMEPHQKRGLEAMNDIEILPLFLGILVHDHWKSYFHFLCLHALCNAHHLRELKRAYEHDGQKWALTMHTFLQRLNKEVEASPDNVLSAEEIAQKKLEYRSILQKGDQECPATEVEPGKKRKPKQSKSRNLLERLRDFEKAVLFFMMNSLVTFTNNLGEREIRMYKVHQKISGCFRSMNAVRHFCRVRSYLATCKKHGIFASDALEMLFDNNLPEFFYEKSEVPLTTVIPTESFENSRPISNVIPELKDSQLNSFASIAGPEEMDPG